MSVVEAGGTYEAEDQVDRTASPGSDVTAVAPEVLAQSLSDYLRAWGKRVRNGESGVLPVLAGLVAIVIFFQIEQSQFLFFGEHRQSHCAGCDVCVVRRG